MGERLHISCTQLSKLNKTSRATFLIELDNRYGSPEIIKARQIIHRFYRKSKNANPNNTPEIVHWNNIAYDIFMLGESNKKADQNDYIMLLNLLDFLESISFFANEHHIEKDEVAELMGISIIFFYTIFKPKIEHRRGKYGRASFYCQFEMLALKIQKDELKSNDQ